MSNNRQNRKCISGTTGNIKFLPQITDRTSQQFLEEILKIHENQYTPINHMPTIFGRKLDLLVLYNSVVKRGGSRKMNTELLWEGVLTDLKIPVKCLNASVALRSIFQRYLEPYERIQRNRAAINEIEEELQMETESRYKTSAQRTALNHCNFLAASMVYRADVHAIDSSKRQESGLSCDLADLCEFQKLEMALKSGLVNEIEFSLNTILLMSFQNEGVQVNRNPRILELILSSIGIGDLALVKDLSNHDRSVRRFMQFWNDNVKVKEGRKFLFPDIFLIDEFDVPHLNKLNRMFKLNDEFTIYDSEGQRVQLVVTIIRNLALDSSNSQYITQSHQCMRLIILCCYSSHFALRQLGLEILSMLSFPVVGILSVTLRSILLDLVCSENRVDRLQGLELLSRVSDQKVCIDNVEFLSDLPQHLFSSLISMLIIHDLHIVVLSLEAVYRLSEVDPYLCIKLVECSSETLSTLYILLSLEAQVMGTQSLIRIRVMQGPGSTNNQISQHRYNGRLQQSNPTQLATSLMPPPPVPTFKSSGPVVSSPNSCVVKPQIHIMPEPPELVNKSYCAQKLDHMVTKNNFLVQTSDMTISVPNSVPPMVKSELITTSAAPPITSTKVSQISPITEKQSNNTQTRDNIPNIIPSPYATVVTIPPQSTTTSTNHIYSNKRDNISAALENKPAKEPIQTVSTTVSIEIKSSTNCVVESPAKIGSVTQIFTNKQDFVKSWLVEHYLESPHNTVPLYAMYKRLQVAVQNYFRDSEMVTAEEFHRLVRILFPKVQLVQLQVTPDTTEINYYNLEISQKITSVDSSPDCQTSKCKQLISSPTDSLQLKNTVPAVHCGESNNKICPSLSEKKSVKRHAGDMVNGYPLEEECLSNQSPRKIPRIDTECHVSSKEELNDGIIFRRSDVNDIQSNDFPVNGCLRQISKDVDRNCNHVSQFTDRSCPSYSSAQSNQVPNFSLVEELKHSDSETKAFSSSTVSPIHCESLINGTDGSSEGTLDSELGKVIAIIQPNGTQSMTQSPPFASNSSYTTKIPSVTPEPMSDINNPDTNANKIVVKKNHSSPLGKSRSRFRNNTTPSKGKQRGSSSQRPLNLAYLYICEWDSCLQSFDKPQKVYGHVYTNHFMTLRTEVESKCCWSGCEDTTQRTPLPLLNHVNEQHCNNISLEYARQIRLAKETENPTVNTSEAMEIKTEKESFSKPLNVSGQQSSALPLHVTCAPLSYQSAPIPSASQPATPHMTPLPTPLYVAPSVVCDTITNTPLSPLSPPILTVEPVIVSAQTSPPFYPSIPNITTSMPILHPIVTSSPTMSHACEPSPAVEVSVPKPQIHVSTSTQPATISSVITSHNSAVASPPPSPVQYPLKEGPVTKHIRFLSALILRNLCQWSTEARRFVAARHQQIFELSISGCESSRALSECLFYTSIDPVNNNRARK